MQSTMSDNKPAFRSLNDTQACKISEHANVLNHFHEWITYVTCNLIVYYKQPPPIPLICIWLRVIPFIRRKAFVGFDNETSVDKETSIYKETSFHKETR